MTDQPPQEHTGRPVWVEILITACLALAAFLAVRLIFGFDPDSWQGLLLWVVLLSMLEAALWLTSRATRHLRRRYHHPPAASHSPSPAPSGEGAGG